MRKTRKSVSTKKEISQCKTLKEKQEDFIMLPTVDFCFKELMQNDNIRKNIIAALLNVPSSEVENTELMPTILRKESKDDKYGILDVRVKLKDGEQIDFEMQVEAFDCWANRSVYYLSKMYTSEIKEGEGYDCLKKCIHVSILAYDHFLDDKECYRRIAFCDTKTGKEYTDPESSRNSATGGTGLGLAIAANVARIHGGSIAAKSSLEGTVFSVMLPSTHEENIEDDNHATQEVSDES